MRKLDKTHFFCFLSCLIVFIFFAHTFNYSWKHFDENIIYEESILPIPTSFQEIFEMVSTFGINHHFEASNPFYSNISNLRNVPVLQHLFIFWLFKKSCFAYHAFSLIFHLISTCLLFLILNIISFRSFTAPQKSENIFRLILISLLTLLWALHPANIESILFAMNYFALVSYSICFLLFFLHLKELEINPIIIFFLYFFTFTLNEYSITFPVVLFFYLFGTLMFHNTNLSYTNVLKSLITKISPYLFAILIFTVNYLFLPKIKIIQDDNLIITLERIFWFSSQIFFHALKLIFYPANLSIDQSALVKISNGLFDPYSIFCSFFMFCLIFLSLISFFKLKKRNHYNFFILFVPFFLALLPFIHIITPIYNLFSERYLYFALFFLVIGISNILFSHRLITLKAPFIIFLFLIVTTLGTRSYLRTLDWKDSISLLDSAVKVAPNNLYKGLRELMRGFAIKTFQDNYSENKVKNYKIKAIKTLNRAMVDFKNKETRYQDKVPQVVNYYGLDPKTLRAKTAYLIAFSEADLTKDLLKAGKIFEPYVSDLKILDTQILNFYYKVLYFSGNFNLAEKILLDTLNKNKLSTTLLIALSDLYEYKYKDLNQTKKYLDISFKYFPYDPGTLFGLKRFYSITGDINQFAYFSYLYGLRTHDVLSFQEAAQAYTLLNKKDYAKRILNKLK